MRSVPVLPVLALCLAGCAENAGPVTDGRISTRAEFLGTVAGRTISNPDTSVTITRDGRLVGITHGNTISGSWEWRDGLWCRTITLPVESEPQCQVWEVDGERLIVTRAGGTGETLVFAFAEPAPEGDILR